jgi:hypothetical protein
MFDEPIVWFILRKFRMKVEWRFSSINRTIFAPSKLAEAVTDAFNFYAEGD